MLIGLTEKEFLKLSAYIRRHSGIDLRSEKKTLLSGRLSNELSSLGFSNFTQYYNFLQEDPSGKKLSDLLDKVTTNHTFFLREAEHFDYFATDVLPYLEHSVTDRDLRIWCAASSSGEEPYTLAIILNEHFNKGQKGWNKKILATDISVKILQKAVKGIYTKEQLSVLPKQWLINYFDVVDKQRYVVKESLKNEVIYRRFNLLESKLPFKKKFHVVFLRNVMIYFDGPTKDALVRKIYDHIEYGGFLFIGHSETINREDVNFQYIRPAVYRKI